METSTEKNTATTTFITPADILNNWLGHRGLTRRVIDAFPEEAFFNHTIGGMRSFSDIVKELLAIAGPGMKEIATGVTTSFDEHRDFGKTKQEFITLWDEATEEVQKYWAALSPEDFNRKVKLFGMYEGTVYSQICYFIDNEIHHRGQGYVYLRSLGIQPPFFYER